MKKWKIILLFVSVLGIAVCGYLTKRHAELYQAGFEEKSFCSVSDFVDCDAVLASEYASFMGIPNSEIGLVYYVLFFLGALYLLFGPEAAQRSTTAFLHVASVFAVIYSIVMAYLSFGVLHVFCLLCTTSYVLNVLLLCITARLLELPLFKSPLFSIRYLLGFLGRNPDFPPRRIFHLSFLAGVFVIGIFFLRGLNPEMHKGEQKVPKDQYLDYFSKIPKTITPDLEQGIREKLKDRPGWGASIETAKVLLVEFSDMQCPYCRLIAFNLKPYLKPYREQVRLVFMNYPLDSSCHPEMTRTMHPAACMAAKTAFCAQQKGRFWEMHDAIFKNQNRLSRTVLLELGEQQGLSVEEHESCMVSEEAQRRMLEDIEVGSLFGVRGTPSLYINGKPFRDWRCPQCLRYAIESELYTAP